MPGEVSYTETGRHYSNSEVAVLNTFTDAKRKADSERRTEIRKRVAVYRDDWKALLLTRLKSMFAEENYKEIAKVFDLSNNPLKRIIEEQSNVYVKPAAWTFEKDNPLWAEILKKAQHKIVFPEINKFTNLCNETFVLVAPVGDALRFHIVTPDNLIVWQDPDDPSQPLAVAYRQGMQETPNASPCWHYWSRGENPTHEIAEGDEFDSGHGRILLHEPNPYVNGKGRSVIPGVMYHRAAAIGSVLDPSSGDDIFEVTILIGCLETWINHIIRTDSLAMKWVTGELDSRGGGVGSATSVLQFIGTNGNPVGVGQFQSQADYKGLGDHVTRKLANTLANHGMSMADFAVTGDPASGFSLIVRKQGLIERRERQLALYETFDLELYGCVAAVWNFETTNQQSEITGDDLPWPEDCHPEVAYADFQTTLTVEERAAELELKKAKVAMGLLSVTDLYLDEHPGATAEEAETAIAENLAKHKALSPAPDQAAVAGPPGAAGSGNNIPSGSPAAPHSPAAPGKSAILALREQIMAKKKPAPKGDE